MMHVTRFALAVATTACLFTLAIEATTSVTPTVGGGSATTTEAASSSSSSSVTNATTVTPQTSTASASSKAPTASPVTDGGASSALSTGSTSASGGAAGSSPTPAPPTTAAPTSTTPKPVCYSQTCTTGGATCTNETGAVCDKGPGQCFQTTNSNSTFKEVVTGCANLCEDRTTTNQTGFTEVHLCCNTDKCNFNLPHSGSSTTNAPPHSGSSMTTASLLLALTSVLFFALI